MVSLDRLRVVRSQIISAITGFTPHPRSISQHFNRWRVIANERAIFAKSRREWLFDGGFLLEVAVQRLSLHNLRVRSTHA